MVRLFSIPAWALFAACAFGQTPEDVPTISVFMDFDSKPAPKSVDVMKHEVEELLKPSGVVLSWHPATEAAREKNSGYVVLKFKGRCRVENWTQPGSEFGSLGEVRTLGQTAVDHGRVLPFSEVECDQVRKGLAFLESTAGSTQKQAALGVAMGRVVAHELYHILAHTTTHATRGLAKASQSLKDLVAGAVSFQSADLESIGNSFK